ncbi:lysophospholipase L1-like esterase [Allocatelliglobosispora scoriae]|uniref:Lysophospholipase L1-like esterase n=1 Tax=Allocatelliglobosispora scoriae TaxID=643052 RepID=A0A841C4S7_9ACTN|nr:fibronectin type III domain-containing protein [Allocatelliglobosispora scoriae]MBB5874299.1 lysophospholipase L1-like esterase [Allocatelliglobosispora scoriae]
MYRSPTSRSAGAVLAALAMLLTFTVATPAQSAAAPVRIMPLGDSITGGPGCWRAVLWDRLQRSGFTDIDFVGTLPGGGCSVAHDGDNEGHGGFKATGIADQNQLPAWLAATRPDIVLMHLGTNDVWNNIPAATILAAFSKLVDQMRASNPNIKILAAQIIPMTPSGCTWCPTGVAALNGAIPGWAAGKSTAQSPITVVDQFTGFDTVADTNGDGVHPDDSGFQKISDRWYPALTPLLGGQTPVPPGAPGTPVASAITASSVSLSWTASSGTVGGYEIERCQGSACTAFAQVGTATTTAFADSGLTAATGYRYRVRATNTAGASPYSGITAVTTGAAGQLPGTISGAVTASGVTATSLTVSWTAATAATSYQLERCTGSACTGFAALANPTTTSYADTGLSAGTTYRYRVRGANSTGTGPYAASVLTVTTTGGGGGGCSATLTLQTGWGGGYVMQPNTVTNTGPTAISGWTVTFTLPAGHALTGSWNATVTVSGQTVTARGITGQNAALGAGAATTWGFQASRPGSDTAVPSGATCTSP